VRKLWQLRAVWRFSVLPLKGSPTTRGFVEQTSGLTIGEQVVIPGDPSFADAIRSIYRLGTYDDVRIVEDRRLGSGVFLSIQVRDGATPKEMQEIVDDVVVGIEARYGRARRKR